MTLAELFDAIDGHAKEENQKREWYLFGVRRHISIMLQMNGVKSVREEDIIPLEMDEEIRKSKVLSNITIDGEALE